MQASPLLSIVIPTYNRAALLDYCLEVNIPMARAHNIQIIISDNASTDATAEVVTKRTKEYPLIRYHCNDSNVGPDVNFERALSYPDSEYVWLLGDTYQIPDGGIDYLLEVVSGGATKYDVVVFNNRRVFGIPRQDYTDRNTLLSDLGWHMTLMASLVFSSDLIASANFSRYRDTNLIQTGIIFEDLAYREFVVHWAEHLSVKRIRVAGVDKVSWESQTFEIWVRRWVNCVLSLPPSYELGTKLKCIKDHSLNTDVFTFKKLLGLRAADHYNSGVYQRYASLLPYAVSRSKILIMWLIALMPRSVAISVRGMSDSIRRIKRSMKS